MNIPRSGANAVPVLSSDPIASTALATLLAMKATLPAMVLSSDPIAPTALATLLAMTATLPAMKATQRSCLAPL